MKRLTFHIISLTHLTASQEHMKRLAFHIKSLTCLKVPQRANNKINFSYEKFDWSYCTSRSTWKDQLFIRKYDLSDCTSTSTWKEWLWKFDSSYGGLKSKLKDYLFVWKVWLIFLHLKEHMKRITFNMKSVTHAMVAWRAHERSYSPYGEHMERLTLIWKVSSEFMKRLAFQELTHLCPPPRVHQKNECSYGKFCSS